MITLTVMIMIIIIFIIKKTTTEHNAYLDDAVLPLVTSYYIK